MSCPICHGPSTYSNERREWNLCQNCIMDRRIEGIKGSISERMIKVGVPSRFLKARLSDFRSLNLKDPLGSFLILGPAGTGKTHLLSALAFESVSVGLRSVFYSSSTLLSLLREDAIKGNTLLSKVCSIPYLFLDDLGTEKQTEWVYETWFKIIDHRYSNSMHLSVTLNKIDGVDERIFRRISAMTTLMEM